MSAEYRNDFIQLGERASVPTAAASTQRVWVDSKGIIHTSNSSGVENTLPRAEVYNNASISIPNDTVTELTFNTERYDTDDLHSTSVNTGRLTCQTAGVYWIGASVRWPANTVGVRSIRIRLNGATLIAIIHQNATSSGICGQSVCRQYYLEVNDYLEVQVYQNSGGALNAEFATNYSPEFWAMRVGA